MRRAAVVVLLLIPAVATADDVHLVGGGKLSGVIVERTPTSLTIRVGPGRLTLPVSRIERIVPGRSPLQTYQERAEQLARDDADGWLSLASWAQDQDLLTQAREAFERVALLAPQNATAQRALGNVRLGDRWVGPEESYRARGYVQFEGAWVTLEDRLALVEERAARAREATERARADEAEARAREAEARAPAAETEARSAAAGGIPYFPFVFPGALGPAIVSSCQPFHRSGPIPRLLSPTPVRRSPPARSIRATERPSRDGGSGGARRGRSERP